MSLQSDARSADLEETAGPEDGTTVPKGAPVTTCSPPGANDGEVADTSGNAEHEYEDMERVEHYGADGLSKKPDLRPKWIHDFRFPRRLGETTSPHVFPRYIR